MITFNGLKLAAAGGGIAPAAPGIEPEVAPCTGTVTGARRCTGGGNGSSLGLTIVTSSGSSLTGALAVTGGCAPGTGANCAVPDAIVRSSINSATVW